MSVALKLCINCVPASFKPFLGQNTVFRVNITFKMVLISRGSTWAWAWAWALGVGVGVGVGRVKQQLKRGWRFLFFLLVSML